jgi:hypothetical protein
MKRLTNLKILIAIPSYNRFTNLRTIEMFEDATVFVPPDQIAKYKENYPDVKFVEYTLPEGNIARKKNFIIEYARKNDYDTIFFIDDDYNALYANGSGDARKITDKDIIYQTIETHAVCAYDLDKTIFTFHNISDIKRYAKHSPMSFFSTFKRGNFGMNLKTTNQLHFDERFILNEDVGLGLQSLLYDRVIYSDNRFGFKLANVMGDKGGLANSRGSEKELVFKELLISKWGERLIKEDGNSWAKRLSKYSVTVNNPFR